MRNLLSDALRPHRLFLTSSKTGIQHSFFFCLVLFTSYLITGCGKSNLSVAAQEIQTQSNSSAQKESNGFGNYTGLAPKTIWELQQAKIATAKYNNFDNAIADGYVDINVIVPEMGYHFLKMNNLNATFEYDKPEILVYNKEENGRMKLVALEYAVPINLSTNAPPGFTGDNDSWSVYQGVLWTLHAWIWEYNPEGVFNPTNPLIHVH